MRHLKEYNFFESKKDPNDFNSLIQNIEDILLPISDLGYNNIEVELAKDYVYYIFVNIINYNDKPLSFIKIEDDILRLNDFVNNNGFEVNEIYYKKVQPDGRIFNRQIRDFSNDFNKFIKSIEYENPLYSQTEMKLAYLTLILKEKSN